MTRTYKQKKKELVGTTVEKSPRKSLRRVGADSVVSQASSSLTGPGRESHRRVGGGDGARDSRRGDEGLGGGGNGGRLGGEFEDLEGDPEFGCEVDAYTQKNPEKQKMKMLLDMVSVTQWYVME